MQFLKILLWVLLAVLVTVFAIGNWQEVGTLHLWGGLIAEVKLPLLVLISFALGLVPTLLYHHAVRWRLRQRLTGSERTIADLRAAAMASSSEPPSMPPGSA